MNIVLGSAFRNAAGGQIDRWTKQCRQLRDYLCTDQAYKTLGVIIGDSYGLVAPDPPTRFRVVAVEGDSTDFTRGQLVQDCRHHGLNLSLVTCNHGQRLFGSTEESDRLKALSQVGNAILSSVNETDDYLIYVESDLIWKTYTILCLLERVARENYDIVAPLVFAGDLFYDVFLFRGLDGNRFSPFYPYHYSLVNGCQEELKLNPVNVQSAGSCLVMKGEIARQCRIRNDQALLGFCEDAREKGWKIFVDPNERIEHP